VGENTALVCQVIKVWEGGIEMQGLQHLLEMEAVPEEAMPIISRGEVEVGEVMVVVGMTVGDLEEVVVEIEVVIGHAQTQVVEM
jgi:hypothetical protein